MSKEQRPAWHVQVLPIVVLMAAEEIEMDDFWGRQDVTQNDQQIRLGRQREFQKIKTAKRYLIMAGKNSIEIKAALDEYLHSVLIL